MHNKLITMGVEFKTHIYNRYGLWNHGGDKIEYREMALNKNS